MIEDSLTRATTWFRDTAFGPGKIKPGDYYKEILWNKTARGFVRRRIELGLE